MDPKKGIEYLKQHELLQDTAEGRMVTWWVREGGECRGERLLARIDSGNGGK